MESREIATALFDALAARDAQAAARLFHKSARHRVYSAAGDHPFVGSFEGVDAIRAQFEAAFARFEVLVLEVREVVVDGARVAVKATVDAVERDGQRLDRSEAMHFLTIEDGRIVEFDVFFEPAQPPEPSPPPEPQEEPSHEHPIRRPPRPQ